VDRGKLRVAADQKKAGQFARPGALHAVVVVPEPISIEKYRASTGSIGVNSRRNQGADYRIFSPNL
jgi:hypothetical protein